LLLEADAAEDGAALGGLEGDRGFRAALRTGGPGLRAHPGAAAGALGLALLAVPGVIFELLVVEEQLLASGEDKLRAAVIAFQDSVGKLHGRLP